MKSKSLILSLLAVIILLTGCSSTQYYEMGEVVTIQDYDFKISGNFKFDERNLNEYNHYYLFSNYEGNKNRIQLYVYENVSDMTYSLWVGIGDKHFLRKIAIIEPNKKYHFDFSMARAEEVGEGVYLINLDKKTLMGRFLGIDINNPPKQIQIGKNGFSDEYKNKYPFKIEAWSGELNILEVSQ